MAWEWVAPTAVAVTGVTGIAATFLTSRAGIAARQAELTAAHEFELQSAIRRERRDSYAAFLGALDKFDRAIADAGTVANRHFKTASEPPNPLPPEIDGLIPAYADFEKQYQDVRLVCGEGTARAASDLREAALDAWSAVMSPPADWHYVDSVARRSLVDAMREDLRYATRAGVAETETSAALHE